MTEKKKKIFDCVFTCIFSLCVIVLLTVVTFSWLPRENKLANKAYYGQNLIITSLNLDITFQVYDDSEDVKAYKDIAKYVDGELVAINDQTEADIDYAVKSVRLNPSDKQSYRFIIKNNSETADVVCDIELRGFYQKDKTSTTLEHLPEDDIFDYLSAFISSPSVYEVNPLRDYMKVTGTGTDTSLDVEFYKNLTIPSGETVNLDWYIELSTEAGNEFMGYCFGFDSIFFSV